MFHVSTTHPNRGPCHHRCGVGATDWLGSLPLRVCDLDAIACMRGWVTTGVGVGATEQGAPRGWRRRRGGGGAAAATAATGAAGGLAVAVPLATACLDARRREARDRGSGTGSGVLVRGGGHGRVSCIRGVSTRRVAVCVARLGCRAGGAMQSGASTIASTRVTSFRVQGGFRVSRSTILFARCRLVIGRAMGGRCLQRFQMPRPLVEARRLPLPPTRESRCRPRRRKARSSTPRG